MFSTSRSNRSGKAPELAKYFIIAPFPDGNKYFLRQIIFLDTYTIKSVDICREHRLNICVIHVKMQFFIYIQSSTRQNKCLSKVSYISIKIYHRSFKDKFFSLH